MPRPADKIFLRLAVESDYISDQDADGIWGELTRLEGEGKASKARRLAVEFGFMDKTLARQVKQSVREYLTEKMREVNVGGTRTVLRACVDAGVSRVVYTSSIAVFGGQGPGRDATEASPFALGATGYAVLLLAR